MASKPRNFSVKFSSSVQEARGFRGKIGIPCLGACLSGLAWYALLCLSLASYPLRDCVQNAKHSAASTTLTGILARCLPAVGPQQDPEALLVSVSSSVKWAATYNALCVSVCYCNKCLR